jgi:branched-chain amino acid transport system permease protein
MTATETLPTTGRRAVAARHALAALLLAVCLLLLAGQVPAHADDGEIIRVTVTDDGAPVEGATVLVTGASGESQGTTDARGQAEVEVAGTGSFEITVDPATLPEGVEPPAEPMTYSKVSSGTSYAALKLGAEAAGASPSGSGTSGPASASPGGTAAETASSPDAGPSTAGTDEAGADEAGTTGSFGHQLATKLVRGTVFGLILALASIGVSLIYGTTGLNNFAHGELVTFGGFVAYIAMTSAGVNGWAALALALILGGAFGWVQNAVLWHPLRRRRVGLIQIMIVSIGLALFLRYLYAFFFGPNRLVMPQSFAAAARPLGVSVSYWDLWGSLVSMALLALVVWILERTRLGKSVRAVADNKLLAATTGIHVERVIRIVWVGGAALAAVSGVLVSFYQTLSFQAGAQILLLIFAAVTLGGLGSAYGALVGSLLLSWFIELSTFVLPTSMKNVAALIVMIIILLVRPQGILGRAQRVG